MRSRFRFPFSVLLLSSSFFPAQMAAQREGIPGEGRPVLLSTNPNQNANASQPDSAPIAQAVINANGHVVMNDGSEIPLNVVIEKVCGNRVTALGYADRKGNFSVPLSGSLATSIASIVDSSDDSRSRGVSPATARQQGGADLIGCELRAAYGGYRSEGIRLGARKQSDNPDVGTIVMRHAGASSALTVSATTLTAPKSAIRAYDHGMDAIRKGNLALAEREFAKAVEQHANFAAAWYELGHLQSGTDAAKAKADFDRALAADPKFILPYLDLGVLTYGEQNWLGTIDITNRGLKLDATNFPLLYYYNAAAHYNLKHLDEAEKKVREAIKVDVEHSVPKADQLLAIILANKGDLQGAAERLRAYLASGPNAADAMQAQSQLVWLEARAGSSGRNPGR